MDTENEAYKAKENLACTKGEHVYDISEDWSSKNVCMCTPHHRYSVLCFIGACRCTHMVIYIAT